MGGCALDIAPSKVKRVRTIEHRNQFGRKNQRGGIWCDACAALATKVVEVEPGKTHEGAFSPFTWRLCDDCADLARQGYWRTLYCRVKAIRRFRTGEVSE